MIRRLCHSFKSEEVRTRADLPARARSAIMWLWTVYAPYPIAQQKETAMATITRKIKINAPVEKVFSALVDPENWTKYVDNLIAVNGFSSPALEPGTTFNWEYRMFGMTLTGKGRVTENEKNRKFSKKMEGSFPVTEYFSFAPIDSGTELTIEISYDMPGKIMSAISKSSVIEKLNQKEADGCLDRIRILCEEL